MGIIKRQASKSTITSFFGIVFSALSAIYIIPMVPQEIYGMVSILLGIASLVLPLTLLGLNSSILRFSETYTSIEREIFFNRVYIIHTLFSLVISCVFYLLSDWLLDLFYSDSRLIQDKGVYISCLIFLMGQFTMLSAYATSKYRLNITRILELIFQKAGIPLLLLAFVLNIVSLYFIVPCIVLFYLIRALGLWYFRFNSKPKLPTTISVHTDSLSIMKYSLFALVAVIIHQAIIDIDTLMVGALVSVSEAGIYKYAFYIAMIVDLPRINLIALLFPLISKYQSQNNFKGINEVYKRSSNLLFVLGSFLIILVIPNLDDFFLLIPNGDIYVHAKWIIIFIALSKLFNMVMGVNFEIIASSKKYYVIILINILVLGVVIISNNILIPLY